MHDAPRHSADSLLPVASLEEYFRDSVDAALATQHVAVGRDTSHYVVQLLTLAARSEASHTNEAGRRPLALLLADALAAVAEEERRYALQRLGDIALFTAGFFADGLQRRSVGIDYYVHMGEGAYRMLATGAVTRRMQALSDVFAELAAKFLDLVDVLNEVREAANPHHAPDVLRHYEHWLRTGSRRAGRKLREAGVQPVAVLPEHRH
jgi:hypothetical protein